MTGGGGDIYFSTEMRAVCVETNTCFLLFMSQKEKKEKELITSLMWSLWFPDAEQPEDIYIYFPLWHLKFLSSSNQAAVGFSVNETSLLNSVLLSVDEWATLVSKRASSCCLSVFSLNSQLSRLLSIYLFALAATSSDFSSEVKHARGLGYYLRIATAKSSYA